VPGAAAEFQTTAMNSFTARRLAVLLLATALAGCAANTTSAPAPAAPAPKPAMTHTQAALECWMATEKGRKDLPLDQRADIVDACIKDKMSGKPAPAAAKPAPKPKPKT
jgi:ABC-type glycerol-3-phosphate transport system substrate-binding protein